MGHALFCKLQSENKLRQNSNENIISDCVVVAAVVVEHTKNEVQKKKKDNDKLYAAIAI